MRPRRGRLWFPPVFLFLLAFPFSDLAGFQSEPATSDSLSSYSVARAEQQLQQIRTLVSDGTLPPSRLQEAQQQLADAQDQATLSRTLYGFTRIEDMTDTQGKEMAEAAQRRVARQQTLVKQRQDFVTAGILAPAELKADEDELAARQRVLQLAENRLKLLAELHQMALVEERLQEAAAHSRSGLAGVMIRYDGSGQFTPKILPGLSNLFQRKFGYSLPVSAIGQTETHASLGLDHSNRCDVALSPDSVEGRWLRAQLEQQRIPYLAFRSAFPGAATGPHIHIGLGSSRLKLVHSVPAHG
jgi:hypothetical protein